MYPKRCAYLSQACDPDCIAFSANMHKRQYICMRDCIIIGSFNEIEIDDGGLVWRESG